MKRTAAALLLGLMLEAPGAAAAGRAVFTNTETVQAMAADGATLWVATRGGLESYDLRTLGRTRLFTTADGLADNDVRQVWLDGGAVRARTDRSDCVLRGAAAACRAAAPLPAPVPAIDDTFNGVRVTARLRAAGRDLVGTAGAGLWLAGPARRRLTPGSQICSNHVVAFSEWRGLTWLGSFDEGLCTFDGKSFRRIDLPARMVNDLAATPGALYIATTKGLWRTFDGKSFRRIEDIGGRGIVDLAADGNGVWAVTGTSLWHLTDSVRERGDYLPRPAGSGALQAVEVNETEVWLASEDRGALRVRRADMQPAPQRRRRRGPAPRQMQASVIERFDRAAGLPSSWCVDVALAPDGAAYVATLRHGLVRVDAKGARSVAGLPDRWLLHVSRAGDGLWVGTQGGAARLSPVSGKAERLAGLPSELVHAVLTTAAGTWVGTEGGTALVMF